MDIRTDLKGLDKRQLEEFFRKLGEPAYRAAQAFQWIYGHDVESFEKITVFSKKLRERLKEVARISRLSPEIIQGGRYQQAAKFLFRLEDGSTIESVLLWQDYGVTACLSSQVGCRWGCTFCASGIGGFLRNLGTAEIVEQLLALNRYLGCNGLRVNNIVMMGVGEPLDNYDAVLAALRLIHEPDGIGIGFRHMTISTCGVVPQIQRLAGENLPITLAVSLHAPNDFLRTRLMPVNRRYPLSALVPACREYARQSGRRVTFEYALIEGVNDSPEMALELALLLKGFLSHVNLIPLNRVEGTSMAGSKPEKVKRFLAALESRGIKATVRRETGTSIDAACGQLRWRVSAGRQQTPTNPAGEEV